MIAREYLFICDECFHDEHIVADNLDDAKQEAKARGWVTACGRKCFCTQNCHLRHSIRKIVSEEGEQK